MNDAPDVSHLEGQPLGSRVAGYFKLTGPGYMQSAMTLGGGSIASCAALGSTFGYKYLWVQLVAMLFGFFVLACVAKQTTNNGERSYGVFKRELHWTFAVIWGGSAFIATILWHFPQYGLAVNGLQTLTDGVGITVEGNWARLGCGLVLLALATWVVYLYQSGAKGLKVYERLIKVLVWAIVVAFAIVVFTGESVEWDRLVKGLLGITFIQDFMANGLEDAAVKPVVGALAAAVGINMIFLYPYSILEKGWGKQHKELAYFDLITGMATPFIIATCLMIVAVAKTIGPEAGAVADSVRDVREILPVVEPALGEGLGRIIIGGGILAIGFSTIITHMLAVGFIGCEMFGIDKNSKAKFWFALIPGVGVFGTVMGFPIPMAITASTLAFPLMPITVVCFIVLLNRKSYMGDEMPTGLARLGWNAILIFSVLFMGGAAFFQLQRNWGSLMDMFSPSDETAMLVFETLSRFV